MAALNKIRSQAGLLVVVIGVALLAFIVGDFLNSGQSFSLLRQNKIATVNGTDIKPEEFQRRAEAFSNNLRSQYEAQNMNLPEGAAHEINQTVYNQMVMETLWSQELEQLGFSVSKEELADLFRGENPYYLVRQRFQNTQELEDYVHFLFHPEEKGVVSEEELSQIEYARQEWIAFEKEVKQARLQEKLYNLLGKAVSPNKLDLEASFNDNKALTDIAFAVQRYGSVADTLVTVTDNELKAEYNKQKENYKVDETRVVKYISINVVPSATDRAEVEEAVQNLSSEFTTTTDMAQFLSYNSDVVYEDAFVAISSMNGKKKSFVEKSAVNEVSELDFANNTYTLYRLMGTKTAPDSVEVRYMGFAPGAEKVDSLLNVLKSGEDFEALAQKHNSQVNKLWLMEAYALRGGATKDMVNSAFAETGKGYFTVKTMDGDFVAQVVNRTAPVKKAKVATFVKKVTPSEATQSEAYNKLVSYIATNDDIEKFEKGVSEAGLYVREAQCVAEQAMLGNIRGSREAVRWAFLPDTEKGSVSDVFTIGNNDAFVAVALQDVIKAGYKPFKEVKAELNQRVLQNKKAEKIIADLTAKNVTTLEGYAQEMNARVDSVQLISFSNPSIQGVGVEPVLNGLIATAEQGKLVGPVQGNNGVYVFTVTNRTENQQPYNKDVESQKMQSTYNMALNQAAKVLYDKAEIENTIYRFY